MPSYMVARYTVVLCVECEGPPPNELMDEALAHVRAEVAELGELSEEIRPGIRIRAHLIEVYS
jgi:hypothetical protein